MTVKRLEICLISLIALHSALLGVGMLIWPDWTLRFFGWEHDGSMFFPAQSGIFLLLFAAAYLSGIWHEKLVWLIVVSKSTAVVFLTSQYFLHGPTAATTLLLAAILDGLMGAAVVVIMLIRRRH